MYKIHLFKVVMHISLFQVHYGMYTWNSTQKMNLRPIKLGHFSFRTHFRAVSLTDSLLFHLLNTMEMANLCGI